MKLIRIEPCQQVIRGKRPPAVKPVHCILCGKEATRQFVYQDEGCLIIEKYCNVCGGSTK